MSNSADKIDLQVQVATLYYRENLSQQEIAQKLNMSRPTISRILRSCTEEGIVSIHIKNVSTQQYDLAKQVKKKYELKHVSVVSASGDKGKILSGIGSEAAAYLLSSVRQDTRIGISAGITVSHMIDYLKPIYNYNVGIYQLQGDASHQIDTCSSFLCTEIAKRLHAKAHGMHVPLLVNTKVLRDLLLEEPFNKKHFQELDNLDMAFVGLGLVDSIIASRSDNWYIVNRDREILKSLNVAGDICGNFIDCDGNQCQAEISDHTISISLEVLKTCKNCVAVAAGIEKRKIARAALNSKLISSLIIDESLATALLAGD